MVCLTDNDLGTSGLLYSAIFCINQKNAFLICKSSVFLPHSQSYSSEKLGKSNILSLLHILVMKISNTVLLLISYHFHIIFELACTERSIGRFACVPAGKQDGRQAGARAGLQASVCMPIRFCLLHHSFVASLLR